MLQKVLSEKIPIWQEEIRTLINEKGDKVISNVTVAQTYGGMRGIKGLTCETSAVSEDKGLIIRGYPLLDITHISPEEVFYLLLTGDLPNADAIADIQSQFRANHQVPDYIWNLLKAMLENSQAWLLANSKYSLEPDDLL